MKIYMQMYICIPTCHSAGCPGLWMLISDPALCLLCLCFPLCLAKQATDPREKPEEEEKDQMARGQSYRLPQTPVCDFVTELCGSALDASFPHL